MSNEKSGVFKFRFDDSHGTTVSAEKQRETASRLLRSLKPYNKKFLLLFPVILIYCVTYVIFPQVLGDIIDGFADSLMLNLLGLGEGNIVSQVMPQVIKAVVIFLIMAAANILQGFIISEIVTSYSLSLRNAMISKFNRISEKYIDSSDHEELLSFLTGDIDALNQSLNLLLANVVPSILLVISVVITQFVLNKTVGSICLLICVIGLLFDFIYSKISLKKAHKMQTDTGKMNSRAAEFYRGLAVLQFSGKVDEKAAELTEENKQYFRKHGKISVASTVQKNLSQVAGETGYVAVAVTCIGFMIKSAFSLGMLQRQLIYARKLFSSFGVFSTVSGILRTALTSGERIFAFVDISDEVKAGGKKFEKKADASAIEFKNVTFGYQKGKKNVIENVSFKINENAITTISGVTGIGKTTLIKLLLGFYKPKSGEIKCFGNNIDKLDRKDYLSRFNVIVQGAELFDGSVAENIAYGSKNVNRDMILEAAKLSGAHEFIMEMEKGYNAVYDSKKRNFSEGQIQLILLARAFLQKKEFIIFDEATASVDVRAEQKVTEALRELSKESTVIIISHRASTSVNSTQVVELN